MSYMDYRLRTICTEPTPLRGQVQSLCDQECETCESNHACYNRIETVFDGDLTDLAIIVDELCDEYYEDYNNSITRIRDLELRVKQLTELVNVLATKLGEPGIGTSDLISFDIEVMEWDDDKLDSLDKSREELQEYVVIDAYSIEEANKKWWDCFNESEYAYRYTISFTDSEGKHHCTWY